MTKRSQRTAVSLAVAIVGTMSAAGSAGAAWEPAKEVDNQGTSAGAAGNYSAIADAGNGLSSAFFEQTVGGHNGYYALRRGASEAAWSPPAPASFPSSITPGASNALSAAADAAGNAQALTAQIDNTGFAGIFQSSWPAAAATPSAFTELISPANSSLADPAIAFDSSGTGYAVAGEGSASASTTDQPILLSTYSPSAETWSTPAPIADKAGAKDCATGDICGQEPRLAVSPDGTVVIAYLKSCSNQLPSMPQCQLDAVRAAARSVAGSGTGVFGPEEQINQPDDGVPTTSQGTSAVNFDVTVDGNDVATIVDAESGPDNFFNGTSPSNEVWATRWDTSKLYGAVELSGANPPAGASWPRVVSSPSGDATVVWAESSQSNPPPSDMLESAEVINGAWTAGGPTGALPETVTTGADSPNALSGYPANEGTPAFSLGEDRSGNAYLVWTNGGALGEATRRLAAAWSSADAISGVSNAVAGTVRVAADAVGQADALVAAGNGSRNALYASRFISPLPAPAPSAPAPRPVTPANPPRPAPPRACYARPVSRINRGRTRASKTAVKVAGVASEHKCAGAGAADAQRNHVVNVYVTVYRPAPRGRCRFLGYDGRISRPRACSRPTLFIARGTTAWSLRLPVRLPAGSYLIRSDAVDGFGRHQARSPASVARVLVKRAKRRHRRHG